MRWLLLLLALPLHSAIIRGIVQEGSSGKSLARAVVELQPVSPSNAERKTQRTNTSGSFEFGNIPAGKYLLKASRQGYISVEHAQRAWNSAGRPITVAEDSAPFLTFRLPRYGAITGAVVDENDVGIPRQEVIAYRASEPPQIATRARADERGIFRIYGLEPGSYFIRTTAAEYNTVGYLPTFAKETLQAGEARPVAVYLDEDAKDVTVRPIPGKLFTVSGEGKYPRCEPYGPKLAITLVSDTGRQTVAGPTFRFSALPPGPYELYAETLYPAAGSKSPQCAAYVPIGLTKDTALTIDMSSVPTLRFDISPRSAENVPLVLRARRRDLAGLSGVKVVDLASGGAQLGIGNMELQLAPARGYYISSFSGTPQRTPGRRIRPDGWNEVTLTGNYAWVRATISTAAVLDGVVKTRDVPVAGVPVFLEAFDPGTRTRPADMRTTRTDDKGTYRFDSLAPGTYRLAATFDYLNPGIAQLDTTGARTIEISARTDKKIDLELFGDP